jgi:serine/threonine protein kinase
VKLLGIISRENPPYLILEYMDNGDLKEYLKTFRSKNLDNNNGMLKHEISASRFYRIAAEIADGMLWLSEHKYIHRDLAARNCLISKDEVIKIAGILILKRNFASHLPNLNSFLS